MLVSVSTVKDSVTNVGTFVRRNLASGLDHMVVFLDAPDPAVEKVLADIDEVTVVVTDGSWWRGERPPGLNRRQNTNANLVKALLSEAGWASWLFHIDGDEVVRVDRERLEALPPGVGIVHLDPLEAVSSGRDGRSLRGTASFKRLLSDDELALLVLLDVLDVPDNGAYFHGHVAGKSAVRPTLDLYVGIHKPRGLDGERLLGHQADWLRVLHLESVDFEEFLRKWGNLLASGTRPRTRGARPAVIEGMAALRALDLPPKVARQHLRTIYQRHVVDDVATLSGLNLLQQVDLDRQLYRPRTVEAGLLADLRDRLELARSADKQVFRTGRPDEVAAHLAALGQGSGSSR